MSSTDDSYLIFQLGTNNWQSEQEPAPGSGILHRSHHLSYNKLDNVKCYSIWPSGSRRQVNDGTYGEDVRIYELDDEIPICESTGPISSRRWHGMPPEERDAYRTNLETLVEDYLNEIEAREGKPVDLAIAHHTFMNPVIMRNVLTRRAAEGKPIPVHAVFVHGTGLKMYFNEQNNLEGFTNVSFYNWIKDENIFSRPGEPGYPSVCYAISRQQIDKFGQLFGETFPMDRIVWSRNGYSEEIFHPIEISREEALGGFQTAPYEGSGRDPVSVPLDMDRYVLFVGRMADWKRVDSVLRAARRYETEFGGRIGTIIVGAGGAEFVKKYQDMAVDFGLQNAYFLGARMQPVLAQLYSVCDVGVFPSKNEPAGLVFIECMACGTPVIGANSGGPRDFVSDVNGVLVEESDDIEVFSNGVADAILQALREDWKANKREGCLRVAQDYTVVGQCNRLLADTKRVLAS